MIMMITSVPNCFRLYHWSHMRVKLLPVEFIFSVLNHEAFFNTAQTAF